MSAVSKNDAVQRLATEIETFGWDDLVETHNELLPFAPVSVDSKLKDVAKLKATILGRVSDGLEAEEIIDLWNVVFPVHRNVWFDEEHDCVHYNEEPQHVESSD